MASFTKGGAGPAAFGGNEYLRSTQDVKKESYTCAASTVALETVNGVANQKVLMPGEAMAKITSGGESGKVGPYQPGGTDGRELVANLVGLNDTFLPWQLLERDVEIAVAYQCTAVQGWCFERNAGGARIALSNTVADALRSTKGLHINFK
jgi:hypothetical protein